MQETSGGSEMRPIKKKKKKNAFDSAGGRRQGRERKILLSHAVIHVPHRRRSNGCWDPRESLSVTSLRQGPTLSGSNYTLGFFNLCVGNDGQIEFRRQCGGGDTGNLEIRDS